MTDRRGNSLKSQGFGRVPHMKIGSNTKTHSQLGFTLIELMVTVSIIAILAVITAPNLQSYIQNNRINTASQNLLSTLQTARSEAMRRQKRVVVCLSVLNNNTPECTTGTPTGWIMFADIDGNDWQYCPPGGNCISANDTLIKQSSLNSQIKILADNGKRVSYDATGFATVNGSTPEKIRSTGFVICDQRGNVDSNGGTGATSVARGLSINGTGRASMTKDRSNIDQMIPTSASCN